jgi:hypothetical protein
MGKMHADDMDLVREFAASGSETAFATLVQRHVNPRGVPEQDTNRQPTTVSYYGTTVRLMPLNG